MSGLVMGLILKHSRSRGSDRLVEVVIGDCCHDDATGAYPSIRTIAARAGVSERTAQRSIAHLEQLGELTVRENAGPKRSNLYEINLERLLANAGCDGDKSTPSARVKSARVSNRQGDKMTRASALHPVRQGAEGCQNTPPDGDRSDAEGDKAMAPDPSSGSVLPDPSGDPSRGASLFSEPPAMERAFEEAWCVYPKRVGGDPKGVAFRNWRARCGNLRGGQLRELQTEMSLGVKRYAAFAKESGDWGTRFVMRASKFFGPDLWWREEWKIGTSVEDSNKQQEMRRRRLPKGMQELGDAYREERRNEEVGSARGPDETQEQLVSATCRRVD
jgi:hypothetical protein